jgi:hypothetical protein
MQVCKLQTGSTSHYWQLHITQLMLSSTLIVNERYRVEIPDEFSSVTLERVLRVLDRR